MSMVAALMILAPAIVGIITLATIAYRERWIIDPASWKRGSPFLMGVWYSAACSPQELQAGDK